MTAEVVKGPTIGIRHLQALLIFLLITVLYIGRINVGVSVVAMTNAESTNQHFPEYDWTSTEISYILSSFFWGYILTQFLGGYLGRRFGAKRVMFWGTFGSAAFSLATPFCIPWGGWIAYCIVRVIQGFFQGLIFPCIHQHLARWSPLKERNRLGALSHTGIECGNVMAMFISGMIAKGPLGWPGIFYISAAVGFAWCILWFFFATDSPKQSRFVSDAECQYIETSLQHNENYNAKKIPVPWGAILVSAPFWALLVVRCAEAWGLSTLQAQIPSYMNGVLEMDMQSNAIYSALPFFAMWFMSYVYLISADILLGKKVLTLTALRKLFNSFACWIPAATLIGIGFLDKEQTTLAIVLMTVSVGVNSGATIGSSLNTLDLSPNHAGILMGVINTASNVPPLLTPLLVGAVVTDNGDRSQWQIIFIVASVIFFVGNCHFLLKGTAISQPWDAEDFLLPKYMENTPPNAALESNGRTQQIKKS
ncbi:putative inorganic phosphate cotransporter [Scaptodrosophila lebanonensis]|uniref:Putative inorganic phosphate cotransporter n=1 Tax=Drosophila lebanonensis TaxID=7225 RepID=A0A6J2UM79_DROLE|nr:putative inorganic phosphate cotransporter [Scaptodrosophila lebanonensis]